MRKRALNPARSDTWFLLVALVMLTFMRIPSVFYNQELNPDESQILTHAITLRQDPVYGRSVDGTTLGPINAYLLLIPSVFGLSLDFITARLMGLLLIASSLVLFFRSLRRLTSPLISRLTLLPVLLFFSWATHSDFLHFSSELPSLLILTACFLLTLGLLQSERIHWVSCLGLGVLAGLVPYAKLQTLPIVGMMLICVTLYWFRGRFRKAIPPFLVLTGGFLLPTVIILSVAYGFGVGRYFIDYYFLGNLTTYTQIYAHVPLVSQGILAKLLHFPSFLVNYTDFSVFIGLTCTVVGLVALRTSVRKHSLKQLAHWPILLVGLTVLGALYSVLAPGTEFGHHLLLLVFPIGWVTGLALESIRGTISDGRLLAMGSLLVILELVMTDNLLLPYSKQLVTQWRQGANGSVNAVSTQHTSLWLRSRNPCLFAFPTKLSQSLSPVSQVISHYTQPSDRIAIWGWVCRYYVESGRAQGVSENHIQRSVCPNAMQNQYLTRYAHELQTNRPALFLDAVGPASFMLRNPSQKHERFTAINRVVQQNYTLLTTVDHVRIYIRRNRQLLPEGPSGKTGQFHSGLLNG